MNKPKFTPGPWIVSENGGYVECGQNMVCAMQDQDGDRDFDLPATTANAQLIARAPEMYDLLHRMATHKGDDLGLFAHEAAQLIKELNQ